MMLILDVADCKKISNIARLSGNDSAGLKGSADEMQQDNP